MSNGLITKSSPINFGGTNKMLQQLIPILAQKKMMDLRNQNTMKYLQEQMQGYRGLETQRHESRLVEQEDRHEKELDYLYKNLMGDLAKEARVDQLRGEIFLNEQRGKDTTDATNKLEQVAKTMGTMLAKEANLETITPEEAINLSKVATEDYLKTYGTQMATTGRQKERLTREVEPDIALGKRRMDVAEREQTRLEGRGAEGNFDDLAKLYTAVSKEETSLLENIDKAWNNSEIEAQLNAELKTLRDEKSMVYNKMKQSLNLTPGVVGGAPTDAFRKYKQLLIERNVPEAEAERIARIRFPESPGLPE